MSSWEKFMFFVPNRFHVSGPEMYVSFNIAVIPPDMRVASMTLCVPLPALTGHARLPCREIANGWDEQLIGTVKPPKREAFLAVDAFPGTPEVHFSLTPFADSWRFRSLENHGVFLELQGIGVPHFRIENPPYLIAATD